MNIHQTKLSGNLLKNINVLSIICFLTIISSTFVVYYYNTKDIQIKIADKGWGPQDYVNQKLYPQNFQKNWDSGIKTYDYSLPMRIYYYLAKYFEISPSKTIYPFMFFQTLLFFLSVAFLAQTLFKNKFVTSICVIVISVSNIAGLNLSRFGSGYGSLLSFPLFYAYANAFRIFALGFFFKNKYILMFIFLALSVYCHVNMGLFPFAFICAYFLFRPRLFRDKSILIGMLFFLILVVPHIFSILSNSNSTTSGGIPVDQWVKSSRIFSFHWYPITMKLFTQNAHMEFFPFLLLYFFFFVALRHQDIKDEKNLKIIFGSIGCMILGILGVVFSEVYLTPFLIKISLQRSTGLITFFGVLYIIYYIYRKMDTGNIVNIFLATFSLLVLVFSKPGVAVLPLFLLLFTDMREGHFGPIKMSSDKIKIAKSSYYIIAFLLLLLTLTCIFQDKIKIAHSIFVYLWPPLQYFNPFYGLDFLLRGGVFKVYPIFIYLFIGSSVITGAIVILRDANRKTSSILFLSIFFLISISIVWYLERDKYLRWHNRYAEIASSYLDVQLWAKNNTPVDALFMPDPSHYYGWRDFSERSSFGNLREWGYSAIAYNPNVKTYNAGIQRMKDFGINIKEVTGDDFNKMNTFNYGQKLSIDLRKIFYNMNYIKLMELSKKYGINYIIRQKKYLTNPSRLKVAYENDNFILYYVGS